LANSTEPICHVVPVKFAFDKFGGILFDDAGAVHRCTLATEHALFGLKFPPGTAVWRGSKSKVWTFLLPANAGVYIPALATMAPPGITLSLADDGRLESIGSGHGQTIIVCGVPLNSQRFKLHDELVVSELAEPFAVVGGMGPTGTAVRIDLATINVEISSE
jgi:hypothetical protein